MSYASVEDTLAFSFPAFSKWENRRAFMISYGAYFDESAQRPGFSVAGYSASTDTWLHLDWAWRDLLVKWKVEYFKASECENLFCQFAQYRDNPGDQKSPLNAAEFERMVAIKTDFINAICKHHDDLQGYGAVVIWEDFERITREDELARKFFLDSPYYVCAQVCLSAAAYPAYERNERLPNRDKVYVQPIFDSHEEYSTMAQKVFHDFPRKNPKSSSALLPPQYDDDLLTPALQVADNLAYEARKLLTHRLAHRDDEKLRKSYVRLRPSVYRIYKLDYKNLRALLSNQDHDNIPIECEDL